MIKFEESFRLHADMAEFLRREIYQQDGIPYHSRRHEHAARRSRTPTRSWPPCWRPSTRWSWWSTTRQRSQLRNPFEQALIAPVLEALADPRRYGSGAGARAGRGGAAPRAAGGAAARPCPALTVLRPGDGRRSRSRRWTPWSASRATSATAILVSATESDRDYLLLSGEFLLDPRRLTVALSRAKQQDDPGGLALGLQPVQRRRGDLRARAALEEPAAPHLHRPAVGGRARRASTWRSGAISPREILGWTAERLCCTIKHAGD